MKNSQKPTNSATNVYLSSLLIFKQWEYLRIKANVDDLNIIQIGITLSDEEGNVPTPVCTWQFNFQFDLSKDKKASNSITLLQNSGIDFDKLK